MTGGDRQVFDARFGISRRNGDTSTCSKCGGSIPEDSVPLMLWDDTGELLWVYCDPCGAKILAGHARVTRK